MRLAYAIRNTFTVFYPVIVDDFHWSRGVTAIMYSLTIFTCGLVAPVAVAILFAAATGYGLGITPPTCFASIADCFHGRNYGSIQSMSILAVAVGVSIGPWLGGFLHDVTGSYTTTFALVQAALVVAAVLMIIANPRSGVAPR